MFCTKCGKEIDDKAVICVGCGNSMKSAVEEKDSSSFGLAFLCFLFPIMGLILYFVYEGNQPRKAKSVAKGAVTGFISGILLFILLVVLYFLFIGFLIATA